MNEKSINDGVLPIHLGASALCLILLIVGWVFGLSPLKSKSYASTTLVAQADHVELEATQTQQELDRMTDQLDAVQRQLAEQPVDLQSAAQINPLLAQLAQWSEIHDLSITRTNAGRPEALTYYDYVPIQILGEGSFADLVSFLNRISRDRADLGVIDFRIERMPDGNGLAFEFDLAWYVLGKDAQAPIEATANVRTQP